MNAFGPGVDPFGGELSHDPAEWARAQLRQRRVVTLTGALDDGLAFTVAAELMALDANGDDAITLQVDCHGGSTEAAFTVMDTIDLLGVPVRVRCVGRADGVATGIVAVAPFRSATPHARFRLAVPDVSFTGSVANVETNAREHQRRLEQFVSRLATATGRAVRARRGRPGARPLARRGRGARLRPHRRDRATGAGGRIAAAPLRLRVRSSGGETRTLNTRVNGPLLCQLSYPGMASDDSKARTIPITLRCVVEQ